MLVYSTFVGGGADDEGREIRLLVHGPIRTVAASFAGDAAYDLCTETGTLYCHSWRTKKVGFDRTARMADTTEFKARLVYDTSRPGLGSHTSRCDFAGDAWVDAGYGEARLTIF